MWRHAVSLCGLLLVIGAAPAGLSSVVAQHYDKRIAVPGGIDQTLRPAITDATDALRRMTGRAFTVQNQGAQSGIVLVLAGHEQTPVSLTKRLAGHGPETFVVRSDGPDRLWIAANRSLGLRHGLYFYLEKLGCRWYLPNPRWEMIPKRDAITLRIDRLVEPAFISRAFGGSGGFGPPNPVDPELRMKQRWRDWKRRNRFHRRLPSFGHVGHAFSRRYAEQLRANPEYRALVDGKRVDYKPGIKLCVSNAKLRDLFIEDRLRAMRQRMADSPGQLRSQFVGVGPSDGSGYCQCAECEAIGSGSESDRVFFMANAVARAVARRFPGRGVSLYAYAAYADPPTIDIEPNVHVWVIPYAFQRTGMSGDALLRAWMKRVDEEGMDRIAPPGLYTYWQITDWGRNVPRFDFRRTPPERLRFWREQGVGALQFESTYSAGTMGLGLYLASRLMWDLQADHEGMIDEFYQRSFRAAQQPMRRMMERWARGFKLTRHELALSFRDLREAYSLTSDRTVRRRIGDFVKYVQYMRRYYEFHYAAKQSPRRERAARELVRLVWRIYPSAMVHSYRLYRLMAYRFAPEAGLKSYLNPTQPDTPAWDTIAQPSADQLHTWVHARIRDYEPLRFERRQFNGTLVPIDPSTRPDGTFIPKGRRPFRSMRPTQLHARVRGIRVLPLKIKVRQLKLHPDRTVAITAHGPGGREVFSRQLASNNEWYTVRIPTRKAGMYRIRILDQKTGFRLRVPAGVPIAIHPFIPTSLSPPLYFYVPDGLKRLAIYNQPLPSSPTTLRTPDGEQIVLEQRGPLVVVDVPPGQDGRVWSIQRNSANKAVELLNAPSYYSLSPDTLMVPADTPGVAQR